MGNVNIGGSTHNGYFIGSSDNFMVSTRGALSIGGSTNFAAYSTGRLSVGLCNIWSSGIVLGSSGDLTLYSTGRIVAKTLEIVSTDCAFFTTLGGLIVGGSTNFALYSTGRLSVGVCNIWSSGITLGSSGDVKLYSTGQIVAKAICTEVTTIASSDTPLPAHGVVVLSGLTARSYTSVAAPITGCRLDIIIPSATEAVLINFGIPIAFSTATATDTPHIVTFTTQAASASLSLVGLSTSLWGLINSKGTITLSS